MKPDADTLTAYTLGLLDDTETREVEAYLAAHPEAAAEVRASQEDLAALVMTLPTVDPPSGGEDRLLDRVRAEAPRERAAPSEAPPAPPLSRSDPTPVRRPTVLWPLAAAAGVALVLAFSWPGLRANYTSWQTARQLDTYRAQPGARAFPLRAEGGEKLGTLVRLSDGRTFVSLRSAPQDGRVYQAWRIAGGKPESLGVFADRAFLSPPTRPGDAYAITVEPPGGSPGPTSAPLFVVTL